MADLDRLLSPSPAAPPPPDFLDVVRTRATRLRRRRAGVAGGALASVVALALLAALNGATTASLEPTDPSLPSSWTPPPSNPPPGSGARERVVAQLGADSPDGSAPAMTPAPPHGTAPGTPDPRAPLAFGVYRWDGPPPAKGAGGTRCIPARQLGFAVTAQTQWTAGPPGWCMQSPSPDDQGSEVPRTLVPDLWNLGVWACREQGAGSGAITLDEAPRLVVRQGSAKDGPVVFDSDARWPRERAAFAPLRVEVQDDGCVLVYMQWDSLTTDRKPLPGGAYYFRIILSDPAWDPATYQPGHPLAYTPGDAH